MSQITYEYLSQILTSIQISINNKTILDEDIERCFLIILEGFDGIEQSEKALSYFSNQFLFTFITSILKDLRCEKENYVIRREMLYRVLDLIVPELIKGKNEFINLIKILLSPSSPLFEQESNFNVDYLKYNLPNEIYSNDIYENVKEGDKIEVIIENDSLKQWEICIVTKKNKAEIIVEPEISTDPITICKENCKGKIALLKTFVEDDSWKLVLKEDDLVDAFYLKKWYRSIVVSVGNQYNNQDKLIIGFYSPTNESESFLHKDSKGRTVTGCQPRYYDNSFDKNSNKLKKNGSITKNGIDSEKIIEYDCMTFDDSEDILLYNPLNISFKKFIIREKKCKSESFIGLVIKFYELKGFDFLISKIKTFSPNEIEFFIDCLEILSNLYFLYHRLYVKEIMESIYDKIIEYLILCSQTNNFKSIDKLAKIIDLLEYLISRLYTFFSRKNILFQLKLQVFNIFLNSKNIEKKLLVLSEIQTIFKGFERSSLYYSGGYFIDMSKIMKTHFIDFLIENNFIDNIFGPSGHWQLIEKSDEIVIGLLDKNDQNVNTKVFQKIWEGLKVDAQAKNEISKLFNRISNFLNIEQIEFITNKLSEESKSSQIELDLLMALFKTSKILSQGILEKLFNLTLGLEVKEKINIDLIMDEFIILCYKNKSDDILKLIENALNRDPPPINIFKIIKKYLNRGNNDNISLERKTENISFIKSLKPLELLINQIKNIDLTKKRFSFT